MTPYTSSKPSCRKLPIRSGRLPILLFLVPFLLLTTAFSALAIEEPDFEITESVAGMEIREYKPQLVAETITNGTRRQAASDGFRILADYIFGNNRAADKIAMTAPVSQSEDKKKKQKIAMTAPVAITPSTSADEEQETHVVRFTMPDEYTIHTLPQPNNAAVTIKELPSRTMAVMRFSGYTRESKVRKWKYKLQQALTEAGLEGVGKIELAQYNPPWTPGFLRRNEVMIQIAR